MTKYTSELISLQGRWQRGWNLVHTQTGDLCSCGQRDDLTPVPTLRTPMWFGGVDLIRAELSPTLAALDWCWCVTAYRGDRDQKGVLEIATIPRGPPDGRNILVEVPGGTSQCRWSQAVGSITPAGKGETRKWGKEFQRSQKLEEAMGFFSGHRKVLHIASMTQILAQRVEALHSSSSCTHFLSPPNSLHHLPMLTTPAWTSPPLHIPLSQPHC